MEAPIISIIVPVYNTSSYLDKCLESLVNQTFNNIEIICINDASTDNSLSILQKWSRKDRRVKIIDSPINRKIGAARNLGIKAATGKYLGFVDSDDYVSSDFFKSLIELSDNDIDVVTANLYMKFGVTSEQIVQFNNDVDKKSQKDIKRYIAAYGCRLWLSIFKKSYIIISSSIGL